MEHSSDKDPIQGNAQGRSSSLNWRLVLVIVLAVGVTIGYLFSQSQATPNTPVQIVVTATSNPAGQPVAQADQQPTQPPVQSNPPATTTTEDSTSALPPTPTTMEFVLSDARHFQGSADAPVTMIEFSDFK